ncbi:hypothetical protein HYR69_06880, partial [Candidatus Sumerlaeota bacterium]|nr:hypothetical protein [Candidatus Sumerlaeota bacterium]
PRAWLVFGLPVLLALIIRLLFLRELLGSFPFFQTTVKGFDQHTYNIWAQEIARGDWLGRSRGVFYYAPIYPYLLSLAYLIGGIGNLNAGFCLNLLFGLLGVVSAAGLGTRLFGPLAGLAAGSVMAINGGQIPYEGILLNDSILPGIALAALWSYIRLAERQDSGKAFRWLLPGLLLGMMITGRASNLLPAFGLSILLLAKLARQAGGLRQLRSRIGPVLFFAAGLSAFPGLCVGRNLYVSGTFAMTSNGPILMYMGNAPEASGVFEYTPRFLKAQEEINKLPAEERDKAWRSRLRSEVLGHPSWILRMAARKTALFFNSWDAPDNLNIYFLREQLGSLKFTLGPFPIYVLGFIGLLLTWRDWRRLLPLYAFGLALAASLIIVFVVGRYKLPFLALLCVFSGAAVERIYSCAARKNWSSISMSVGAALLGAIIFYPRTVDRTAYAGLLRPNEYLQNGQALAQAGRSEEAKRIFGHGQELFPRLPNFAESLAAMDSKAGDWNGVLSRTQPYLENRIVTQPLAELHVLALLNLRRTQEGKKAAEELAHYFPASEILRQAAAITPSP